jgi:GrpB-like predicted nucleotidyltransferase (UPF0157 family)
MSSADGREVVIADYDPAWAELFETEKTCLIKAAGGAILEAHHAGSTAVPGLAAKPIVDIVVELSRPLNAAEIAAVEALGYEYRGEQGISGRQYFSHRVAPSVHVHCYVNGHPDIERMLTFRDYLRSHPDTAAAYETLKRRLAVCHRFDRVAYTEAKTEFVRSIDARAAYGAEV